MATSQRPFALLTGTANPDLAQHIARQLKAPLASCSVGRFADGETRVEIEENIRGMDVFILQPTCPPVNDTLMELLLLADAAKRASAARITAVMPYYGYARQDRKATPRAPISARLVADMLQSAGIDRVMTLDIHTTQIQGFFSIPMDNLHAAPMMAEDISERFTLDDIVIVAPDVGGVARARSLARRIDAPLAIIDKRRDAANACEALNLIGDVKGKTAILIDDMIDTAGTMCTAAAMLKKQGKAEAVHAYASHGLFSGSAVERLKESAFESISVTNSLPLPRGLPSTLLRTLDISGHIACAIDCVHKEDSIQALYETPKTKAKRKSA